MASDSMNKKHLIILFAGVVLTGMIMRGPMASVGSLVALIAEDISVNSSKIGLITTIPLIVFSVSSLMIPRFAHRFGLVRTLVLGMLLLLVGCIARISGGYPVLLAGTLLLGLGISTGNVLLPSIIKERAPDRIGVYTGSYLGMQNLFAAFGAAFSYPLAMSVGWRISLGTWVLPVVLCISIWLIYSRSTAETEYSGPMASVDSNLLKSGLAWLITVNMGLQSLCYYCLTAWLPLILQESSIDIEMSGYFASLFQLLGVPAMILTPIILAKIKSKYIAIVGSGICYVIGMLILIYFDSVALIVIGLIILATGGASSFAWVVAMIALVSKDPAEAARLSGMSQFFGYIMAAIGPTLAGAVFDVSGSWFWVLIMIIAASVGMIVIGMLTRNRNTI